MILANLIITSMLACLIWIIQLVHYPSFRYIDKTQFSSFESFHARSISIIVTPLMLMEIFISFYMITLSPLDPLHLTSGLLVFIIWLSTFFFSVPCHNRLMHGYHEATVHKLIITNWPRTLAWSVKLILAIYLQLGDING